MKTQIGAALTVIAVIGAGYFLVGDSFSTVSGDECTGVPFTLGGQQYSSLSEVQDVVENNPSIGASYSQIKNHYDLCVKDGTVLQEPTPEGSN